nr:phospholipase-like protein [Tanacetum cinerariifolium]
MLLVSGETENVPLYYHMYDNFQIQFGREEFCLVTGLKFGIEYPDEYDQNDKPIPFRRRVFPSWLDGLEDRRAVPNWILRLANDRDGWDDYPWGSYVWPTLYYQLRDVNVKRWLPLYATEPTNEDDKKSYSIFGFTWAFKTWILEVFRLRQNEYYTRYMHYLRIVAWTSNKKFYRPTLRDFLHGRVPAERLIPDEGGPSSFQTPTNNSIFNMGTPTNWQTSIPSQPCSFNLQRQMPAYTPTPNWQPPIPWHLGDAGLCDPNILERPKRVHRPSVYIESPYTPLHATTELPKKRVGITKKNSKNDNLSPLNIGNAFAHDNVGGDNVLITGVHDTCIYFTYENVDPNKVTRQEYNDFTDFILNPYQVYLDCYMMGYLVYMPINVGGNHWVTGVVNLPHSIFNVFDSMESQRTRLLLKAQIKAWTPVINGILQTRGYFEGSEQPYHNFILSYNQGWGFSVPQQTNFKDFGVITCWLIAMLCVGHVPVVPRESESYWENIRYEVGELFYKCRCENTRYCGYD